MDVDNDMVYLSPKLMAAIRGCNSVVECHLPMVNVVGSSPIARFICIAIRNISYELSFVT